MQKIIILIFLLLSACSRYSLEQALNDCSFQEVKSSKNLDANYRDNYMLACMQSKGYTFSFENSCTSIMSGYSKCWTYTWHVFL